MIGDNPEVDVEIPNKLGWKTILVRTGIFSEGRMSSKNS